MGIHHPQQTGRISVSQGGSQEFVDAKGRYWGRSGAPLGGSTHAIWLSGPSKFETSK